MNAQHSLAVYSSLCKLGVDLRCSYPLTPASSLSQQSSHNDVRFFFPRIDRELWANAEFLKLASPYFKTLLESDFAEGQKRERSEHVAKGEVVSESTAWEDSDDESDQALAPKDLIRDDCHVPIHQVVVTETAYTTYTAVLIYLSSGVINFTKLHAAEKSSEQLSTTERSASPKSVYRLAHLLSLPDLCALAFAAIEEQLSPDNAFAELLSPVSVAYDEVSNMISTYMIEHWDEIKQVLSVEGMLSKMQEEGVELPLEVMMKLLLKLKG